MTLRQRLAHIDEVLATGSDLQVIQMIQEYRAMIAQCVENEYPGPAHTNTEVDNDMPTL